MTYSERLCAAQDAALERAYMASLEPPDDYYFDLSGRGGPEYDFERYEDDFQDEGDSLCL